MRVGSQKIHVLHRRRKRAERLNRVEAEQNAAFAQRFSDGVVFQPEAADEMAGRQRDEPGVFIHLSRHVLLADDAEAARVEQAHLDAAGGQRHPRIHVRRIIVVVNQDVVATPELQSGGDEAQCERGRPDQRDFVRLAVQQPCAELARVVEPVVHEGFLVAERGLPRAIGDGVGHAARQRTNAGMREEDFVACDGEFRAAQFLIRQDFSQRHVARLNGGGSARKAESKIRQGVDVVEVARPEAEDLVSDKQHDEKIYQARHPCCEGM